jgi:prepilin-type N-terminal cleavage/methylation domain-containing protein
MKNKSAFTFIELLVVVAIVGILVAFGVIYYGDFTTSSKKNMCLQNAKFFHKEITLKWSNAENRSGPDIEIQSSGFCFLHWLPNNSRLNNTGIDILANIKANRSIPQICNSNNQGNEHIIMDHFYGMGYRNTFDNSKPAIDSPGRGDTLREGGSVIRCGTNAGLSDPYQCKIISLCKLGEQTEILLTKTK